MPRFIDLTGMKFGRWTVLKRGENSKKGETYWLCECDCVDKTQRVVYGHNLRSGESKSCGCLQRESNKSHGLSDSRIYTIYKNMLQRCYDEANQAYKDYGGRGIKVCADWLGENGLTNFYDWAKNNGYDDHLTIDRIDNNGNYEPDNCKWSTLEEQGNNKRNNILIEINGEIRTVAQWAKISGVSAKMIYKRLKYYGWRKEDILKPSTKKSMFN